MYEMSKEQIFGSEISFDIWYESEKLSLKIAKSAKSDPSPLRRPSAVIIENFPHKKSSNN